MEGTMKRRNRSFRFKLYGMFIVSIIVPMTVLGIFFVLFYSRSVINQEEKNMEYVLKSINNSMQVQMTELKNIGDTYYMQKEIFHEIEALNNPKLYENYDDLMKSQLETNYSISIIKALYMSEQNILDVVFFPIHSESGQAYYVDKNHSGIQVIGAAGYEEEEWFRQAIDAGGVPVFYGKHTPQYREEKRNPEVYSCVRAMQNMDSRKIIGVIKIDADIANLKKTASVVSAQGNDNIVISQSDTVLAASKDADSIKGTELRDGIGMVDGNVYYMQSAPISGTDWKLTYLFSMQTVFFNYLLVIFGTCTVTAAAVFAAFSIYRRYARETVDDMEHITAVFREIQTGNLDVEARVQSGNELHDIADAVNQMIYNLKDYINKEYIWVIRQQKAEYKALQAQINPHFLYNTLNGFIALNRMGETKKLEKSIINLTYLFRYICNDSEDTTVERECDFLREYLELEKLKYEERLEYMIWVDEACRCKRLPKLLLQPIVENSIVHGMGDTDEPIMITVLARSVETKGIGRLTVISIRDNGVGFDRKQLQDGKEHIGIDNVKSRAELFSKDVIYQCLSEPGKGTKTTIVLKEYSAEG